MQTEAKQKKPFINVQVTPESKKQLEQEAADKKISLSELMRQKLKITGVIAIFILGLTSCSSDKPDCHCTAEYRTESGSYLVSGMPIDCETKQPLQPSKSVGYFVGCDNF